MAPPDTHTLTLGTVIRHDAGKHVALIELLKLGAFMLALPP